MADIPEWAWDEVRKRVGFVETFGDAPVELVLYVNRLRDLAAELIAKHETQPVDPLLIEAREIVAGRHSTLPGYTSDVRAGKYDLDFRVTLALYGLRRGIELAKGGEAQ